jgi:hypothetical protein
MSITIPPEALQAGARAITMALILAVEEDCRALALTDDERTEVARAACLAMLQAWPGMRISWLASNDGAIVLPLPTEASDDQ